VYVEYKGYNGKIEVDGEKLAITHSGLVAKSGGLVRDQPRTIPLQAISGVAIKEATRLGNGWITLGLGGADAVDVGSQAASNPDTVMFRHKDNDEFKRLHDWLVTVVEYNRSTGVDFSAVQFDAAGQTRAPRIQTKADESAAAAQRKKDELQQKREDQQQSHQRKQQSGEDKLQQSREDRQTDKMSQMLGDERPDIVAAAARMGRRMGGKRELKNLASHLLEGETVRFIAQGTYDHHQGILVLTDVRLLFLFHGIVGQSKEDFPLRLISSVQTKSGLGTGELKVFVSGNHSIISGILKSDLEPLANAVRQGMAAQHGAAAQPQAATPPATDPYEALQKLASLRDAGILSSEEFEAKKQELLKRL
jgi:Bacterial PH domain/Short C-terminal domain/Domain of unknown function (DUF4429)